MKQQHEFINWKISGGVTPLEFLSHLEIVIPEGGTVAFEISKRLQVAPRLYNRFPATERLGEWKDNLTPISDVYFVNWTPELKSELLALLGNTPVERLFWHIKVYHRGFLWVWYHDAYLPGGIPVVSPLMEKSMARRFAKAVHGRLQGDWSIFDWWSIDCRKEE